MQTISLKLIKNVLLTSSRITFDLHSPPFEMPLNVTFFLFMQRGAGGEWHKLYIPGGSDTVSPVHTRSFNLTGLDTATHYEAVVLSRNRYGWSHPSEILRFHTEGVCE